MTNKKDIKDKGVSLTILIALAIVALLLTLGSCKTQKGYLHGSCKHSKNVHTYINGISKHNQL